MMEKIDIVPTVEQVNMLPAPEVLTVDQMAAIITVAPMLKKFLDDVSKHALNQASKNGLVIPGFKVVRKNAKRKLVNQDLLVAEMVKAGYSEDLIYKDREVETLTNLEKLVGKKKFNETFGKFIETPLGDCELAPINDVRPEVVIVDKATEAANDFKD